MDLQTMSDEEFKALEAEVLVESARRESIRQLEEQASTIAENYLRAVGRDLGEPYVEPRGAFDAYPFGWIVTHGGKTWKASRHGAAGEPGVVLADWTEVVEEGEVQEWRQPQAGQEFPVEALVHHVGRLWRNDHTGPNGWEPGTTGSQWTDLGPWP